MIDVAAEHLRRCGATTPSITEVISSILYPEGIPSYWTDAGRQAGTDAHERIENSSRARMQGEQEALLGDKKWELWMSATRFTPVYVETRLYCSRYNGMPDVVGRMGENWWLVEIKNNQPSLEYLYMQLGAQRKLVTLSYPEIKQIKCGLYIAKLGIFKMISDADIDAGWTRFAGGLQEFKQGDNYGSNNQ